MVEIDIEAINVEIRGRYVHGKEEGRRFVSIPWALSQFKEKLGFTPYPGTLNVKVDELSSLRLVRKHLDGAVKIVPPSRSYCLGLCFKAVFEGGEPCAVVIPLVKGYYTDIVEVIAPVELRKHFKLREGDRVKVNVEVPIKRVKGLKAVIFDIDGTIFDNVKLFYRSFNEALRSFKLDTLPLDRLKRELSLGKSLTEILSNHAPSDLIEELYEEINVVYKSLIEEGIRPLKGVRKALNFVKSHKILIGAATGSDVSAEELEDLLSRSGVAEYFDVVVTRRDVKRGKPYPDIIWKCIELLGVEKEGCVYVGDSAIDVRTGKAAGISTISVLTGVGALEDLIYEEPDLIIDNLGELPSRIAL